jgi:hypothetical protein
MARPDFADDAPDPRRGDELFMDYAGQTAAVVDPLTGDVC